MPLQRGSRPMATAVLGRPILTRRVGAAVGGVKSRLGFKRGGVTSLTAGTGIKSRLGPRGSTARPVPNRIVDARQKINLNRIQGGRVGKPTFSDARNKIQAKRLLNSTTSGRAPDLQESIIRSGEPLRNLIITTPNTAAPRGSLFQNAVHELGQQEWSYGGSFPTSRGSLYSPEPILSRTISNNLHVGQLRTSGRSAYSPPPSASSRYGGGMRSDHVGSSSNKDYEYMDVDRPVAPARRPLQSRLDSQFKIRVSNLQPTVSVEDVAELFSDVGDLVTAKSLGGGVAEAYYRTRADCLKAVDTYHNRLLDGRPMFVVFEDRNNSGGRPSPGGSGLKVSSLSLKSAAGASSSIKLPKASSSQKVHPDLSAIHKVLFQPASSSSVTKMLFKGGH